MRSYPSKSRQYVSEQDAQLSLLKFQVKPTNVLPTLRLALHESNAGMRNRDPFAAIHVTSELARRFECQARQLLNDTLREYDTQVDACQKEKNPLHDKWQWKPLKTHEGLNVFRATTDASGAKLHHQSSFKDFSWISLWPLGHLIDRATHKGSGDGCVHSEMAHATSSAALTGSSSIASIAITGHIDGTLNDAMYGLVATDTIELQLRLRYMLDAEVLDTAMVSCIQTPSTEEPFRFLGVQWLVRGEPSRVKSSSRHSRDFMLLVASGVVRHRVPGASDTQEVGYYLCQSVDMPACGELENRGLTKGWLSTCSLFTSAKGSSVQIDVFSRGYVDFKGKMQDYQAATMMTNLMLSGVTEAATCGQSKKLSWLLTFKGAAAEFRRMQPEPKTSSNRCGICERKFGVLNSVASCNLCQVKMCSRCRSRSWDEGQASGQVRFTWMPVSWHGEKSKLPGIDEMARTAPIRYGETPAQQARSSMSNSKEDSEHSYSRDTTTEMCFWTPGSDTNKLRGRDDKQLQDVVKPKLLVSRMDSGRSKLESSVSSFASTLPSPRDRDSSQEDSSIELTPFQPRQQHQPQYISEDPEITYTYTPNQTGNVGNSQADLVRRMQELQKKSESVYQFTSQMNANTRYRHHQFVPANTGTCITELD
ncbi:hypothetical protein GN244_ATG15823 [Phytophthora infestans]|uniref:FYVE-type domain-containing protein n=1 Tax=Phytophthora infestans TaxID=4787 RepID=A0A833SLT7_PHYIN|nr:hypothetical protein GN244_ATG15823 [Phytophthora infestans]